MNKADGFHAERVKGATIEATQRERMERWVGWAAGMSGHELEGIVTHAQREQVGRCERILARREHRHCSRIERLSGDLVAQ